MLSSGGRDNGLFQSCQHGDPQRLINHHHKWQLLETKNVAQILQK